jgi:hypothetical protein
MIFYDVDGGFMDPSSSIDSSVDPAALRRVVAIESPGDLNRSDEAKDKANDETTHLDDPAFIQNQLDKDNSPFTIVFAGGGRRPGATGGHRG